MKDPMGCHAYVVPVAGRAADWTKDQPLIQGYSVYRVPRWPERKGWPVKGEGHELIGPHLEERHTVSP